MRRIRDLVRLSMPGLTVFFVLGSGTVAVADVQRDAVIELVAAEVRQLQERIEAASPDDASWPRIAAGVRESLDGVSTELEADRLVLAVERLSSARNTLLAYLYSKELESDRTFESEWQQTRGLVSNPPAIPEAGAAALRALAQEANGRMQPYHSASRAYAAATDDQSGLFYLGRARAYADFVELVERLATFEMPPAPKVRSYEPELSRLDERAVQAYRPPNSIDRHDDFITFSAALKLSRELNAHGSYFGALHQYLEARRRLSLITMTGSAVPPPHELRAALDGFAARLNSGERDDTIGLLFWQSAESMLEGLGRSEAAAGDALNVRVVLDVVLPAYFAAVEPRPAARPAPSAEITVTLVRWPYT